jgi:hypothetical protein
MSKIAEMDKSMVFLPSELKVLDKTLQYREMMVEELFKDGVPKDTRKMRIANELLTSIDSQVLGRVDRRLKHDENENAEDVTELLKELFFKLEQQKSNTANVTLEVPEIPEALSPDEIVPGEDKIEYEEIELSEIVG